MKHVRKKNEPMRHARQPHVRRDGQILLFIVIASVVIGLAIGWAIVACVEEVMTW